MAQHTAPDDVVVERNGNESVLRIKNTSNPQSVAAALSHALYDDHKVVLRAIGAGAVNQAMKACAIASGFVAPRGISILVRPGFCQVDMPDGETLTGMTFGIVVTS